MKYEIKRCDNGNVIFTHECDSWKICVEAAIKSGVDLSGANLYGANMSRANMSDANLYGANLSRANMSGVDLKEIKNAALSLAQTHITPQEGSFVGWKKLRNGVIAKIVITHDARRINAVGSRKCRASKVFVHEMYSPDGAIFTGVGIGQYDSKTTYETGKETIPDSFDDSITDECSHGIHFFLTREEAEAY